MRRPPPRSTLFPYTTLFRSGLRKLLPVLRHPHPLPAPARRRLDDHGEPDLLGDLRAGDRKSTRLNSSHSSISYAVFCLKKKKKNLSHTSTITASQHLPTTHT